MIQNKKLFIIAIAGIILCGAIDVPLLIMQKVPPFSLLSGIFFIGNAIFGLIIYSLVYMSLKKTEIVKKIYRFALLIGIMVFVMGIIVIVYAII